MATRTGSLKCKPGNHAVAFDCFANTSLQHLAYVTVAASRAKRKENTRWNSKRQNGETGSVIRTAH